MIVNLLLTLILSLNFHLCTCAQFTLSAFAPGSPLDSEIVNAAGRNFFLGGETASYCPLTNQTLCPTGNQTIFAGLFSLFVEVPGGQQIYVEKSGEIGFTAPHSASTPPGSIFGGFTNVTVTGDCSETFTVFNWEAEDHSTHGIFACSETPVGGNETAVYHVFAKTPGFNETDCVELAGLKPTETPDGVYGAWEYT